MVLMLVCGLVLVLYEFCEKWYIEIEIIMVSVIDYVFGYDVGFCGV